MSDRAEILAIAELLRWHGPWAYGDDPDRAAQEWADAGFSEEAVDAWLEAGCAEPDAAKEFEAAGITPTEAARWTDEEIGLGGYRGTIALKVSNGHLSVDEAVAYLYGPERN